MEPLQLLLILTGLAIAIGGVLLLTRSMKRDDSTLRPYLPFATIAVGLAIAYRSYADYKLLDAQDITIMFVFVLALFSLLGLQFFVVDKHKRTTDDGRRTMDDKEQ
jgi:membrane-bound ClpP family serine protease